VTVEGHVVGHLAGVTFTPEKGASALEEKALRNAAVSGRRSRDRQAPGQAGRRGRRRLRPDPDGAILWRGEIGRRGALSGCRCCAARPAAGRPGRRRGARAGRAAAGRLPGREVDRKLAGLRKLERALGGGELKGLPRGLAHRLLEAGGVLDKRPSIPT
jgi:ATP-dependent RNA helicase SUPV3L1/SUV3